MSSISSGNFSQIAGSYADTAAVYSKPETTKTDETSGKKKVSGQTIGNPKLSEKASKYYEQLKKKYSNMNFILVSEDQKENAKANAAGYANSNNMVVLIDENKIERMASDENYRKQYEGIIANAASGISQLASSLSATGTSVKGFGMQVNDNGTASYFAVLEKSSAAQKERIEKNAAKKKTEQKAKDKKAEKKAEQERIKKNKDKSNKIRELTDRHNGWGNEYRALKLTQFIRGWVNYFGMADMKGLLQSNDKWLRHRIRAVYWKQWKKPKTKYRKLKELGMNEDFIQWHANMRQGIWNCSNNRLVQFALSNEKLREWGYPTFTEFYLKICEN